MKNFKNFLLEAELSYNKALEILNIDSDFDKKSLSKAYKIASVKSHPDKGGSVEAQQNVNKAFEILSKAGGKDLFNKRPSFEERKQKRADDKEQMQTILSNLFDKFDIDAYTKYFESYAKEKMNHELIISASDYASTIYLKFVSESGKIFFNIRFYTQIFINNKSLSGNDDGFIVEKMSTDIEVLVNREKHKMGKSDWSFAKTEKVFKDPKGLFPTAKLKKIFGVAKKPKKLKKADYMTTFKNELKAQISGNDILIRLNDDSTLYMNRGTMFRKGYYQFNQVRAGVRPNIERELIFASFSETETPEVLDLIVDTVKPMIGKKSITVKEVKDTIEKAYKKYKKDNGLD